MSMIYLNRLIQQLDHVDTNQQMVLPEDPSLLFDDEYASRNHPPPFNVNPDPPEINR